MRKAMSLGLLAVLLAAGAAPAQTTLRFKFKEGEKLDYVMDQKMKTAMNVNGMDIDTKVDQVVEMTWHVKKVDEQGNAQVHLKIGRVKMNIDSFGGNFELDSANLKEDNSPTGKILGGVVGAMAAMDMTFTMGPTGEMKDTKVSEEATKKLADLPGADKFAEFMSPEALSKMANGGVFLPKEAVEKGKSWKQQTDAKTPFGKMTGDMTYTYEGEEQKDGRTLAKIAVKPVLKVEADPDAQVQLSIKEQDGKGHVYFDSQAGRIVETVNESKMVMAVEVNGMTINQSITQNTSLKLKGREDKSPQP
jgi:hypothetical protein